MESVVIQTNLSIYVCMNDILDINQPVVVESQFSIGSVVTHTRYNFRAVVVDVDGTFQGQQSVLDMMPESDRPSKNQPWYKLLVHGGEDMAYVAECMLYMDSCAEPIQHPMLDDFLTPNMQKGCYQANTLMN